MVGHDSATQLGGLGLHLITDLYCHGDRQPTPPPLVNPRNKALMVGLIKDWFPFCSGRLCYETLISGGGTLGRGGWLISHNIELRNLRNKAKKRNNRGTWGWSTPSADSASVSETQVHSTSKAWKTKLMDGKPTFFRGKIYHPWN